MSGSYSGDPLVFLRECLSRAASALDAYQSARELDRAATLDAGVDAVPMGEQMAYAQGYHDATPPDAAPDAVAGLVAKWRAAAEYPNAMMRATLLTCARELAALRAGPVAGEGFVVVPREPTEAMLSAGYDADCEHVPGPLDMHRWKQAEAIYRAMVAAAEAK